MSWGPRVRFAHAVEKFLVDNRIFLKISFFFTLFLGIKHFFCLKTHIYLLIPRVIKLETCYFFNFLPILKKKFAFLKIFLHILWPGFDFFFPSSYFCIFFCHFCPNLGLKKPNFQKLPWELNLFFSSKTSS